MLKNFAEGYKPQVDWGGGSGDAALVVGGQQVRLPAWREKLLYALMGILLVMAVCNFLATLWVLSKISFNTEGLGALHVERGGLQLWGRSWLKASTNAHDLRSRTEMDLKMYGYHNTSIYGLGDDGQPVTAMLLDQRDVTILSNSLRVTDETGAAVFTADDGGSSTSSDVLRFTGPDGAVLNSSTQTPLLLGRPQQQLSIESNTRGIHMHGSRVMSVQARDGDISATSLNSMTFTSKQGSIRFLTPSVYMPNLPLHGDDHLSLTSAGTLQQQQLIPTTQRPETQLPPPVVVPLPRPTIPSPAPQQELYGKEQVDVYQVCVCPSGRLFLAPATTICVHDAVTCR